MKGKQVNLQQTTYEELLMLLHGKLIKKYGSITAFAASKDYVATGLDNSETGKTKVLSYLSLPKNVNGKKVKSLPTLKLIAEKLFDMKVDYKVEVTRKMNIQRSE